MQNIGGDIVAKYDRLIGPSLWELVFAPGPRPAGFPSEFENATAGRRFLLDHGYVPASTGAGAPIGPEHDSFSQLHYAGHGQAVVLVRRRT